MFYKFHDNKKAATQQTRYITRPKTNQQQDALKTNLKNINSANTQQLHSLKPNPLYRKEKP
ncbi:hypothetical protein, partial [Neisseria cinerea]|uniref:hypothetical protein n=1 Tax=Neisseria cinerea TaxID=483 RepID=UPI002B1D8846